MQQKIRWAIARVEVRSRVVILGQTEVVAVETKIDIEAAVVVVVGHRSMGEGALRGACELKCVALEGKCSGAVIEKQKWAAATNDEEILHTLIFEIGEQRAGGGVEHTDAGFFGDVVEGAVAAIAIETIGKSRRLADVEVVETVVVNVGGGEAVVAVDVDAARAVEHGAPVVDPAQHLLAVRFGVAESLRGNVDKDRRRGAVDRFRGGLPSLGAPRVRLTASPARCPISDALFARAIRARRAHRKLVNALDSR